MLRCRLSVGVLLVAVVAFAASGNDLLAQGYPNRPIRVIVPYGAGGGTDITLRAVQKKTEAVLGQSFIIEYRAGGGTLIGTKVVEAAAPDGYTLGVFDPAFIINPTISSSANYDPLKNFMPVSLISATPLDLCGAAGIAVQVAQGAARLRQGQPGQTDLRLAGHRQRRAYGDGAVLPRVRSEDRARSLQGFGAGHRRFAGAGR